MRSWIDRSTRALSSAARRHACDRRRVEEGRRSKRLTRQKPKAKVRKGGDVQFVGREIFSGSPSSTRDILPCMTGTHLRKTLLRKGAQSA